MSKLTTILLTISFLVIIFLSGCTSTKEHNWTQKLSNILGDDYRVTLYSGGKAVREWQLRHGIVNHEKKDDGWFFSCRKHLVVIRGEEIVIEPLAYSQPQVKNPVICN
ncbi:MAG: hypothetical protein SWZ49_11335 [Cyanobacteriota bacterium]|nr:hypothetical protein [Cyanobacteriota bacterium]